MRYGALSAVAATILLAGTAAYASDTSSSSSSSSNYSSSASDVCSDSSLSTSDQAECRSRMNNANTASERQQIQRTYEARKTGSSSSYSTTGPTTDSPRSTTSPSSSYSTSPGSSSSSSPGYSGTTGAQTDQNGASSTSTAKKPN